jgi:hypothetical protein
MYLTWLQTVDLSDMLSGRGLTVFLRHAGALCGLAALGGLVVAATALQPGEKLPAAALSGPASAFALVLAYVAIVRLVDSGLAIPSLERLSDHISALLPMVVIGGALWAFVSLRYLIPRLNGGSPHIVMLCTTAIALTTAYYPTKWARAKVTVYFWQGHPLRTLPDAGGWNWRRCEELQQSTANARIVPLNAWRAMVPCYFSAALPRGKIVHPYESDVARDFRRVALSSPDVAESTYRSLGINIFYVEKGNCDFWATSFGPLFRRDELARRFALQGETPTYWLLTWRERGRGIPVTTVDQIVAMIELAKEIYQDAYGLAPFDRFFATAPRPTRAPSLSALDRLGGCSSR